MYRSPLLAQFRSTPWGAADHVEARGPGIHLIGTPSHGGFHVAAEQLQQMPEALRSIAYPALPWFEEDCSWCAVALAFPSRFDAEELEAAERTAREWQKEEYAAWIAAGRPTAETGEAA
jgi:hypothetical protein